MNKGIISSLLALALATAATAAHAVPAFARKYDSNCSSCHNAYPQLNKAGRKFKEAGYAFPKLKGETTISDFLHFDSYLPASAVFKIRPYDKKNDGDEKLRALHEVELMVAGRLYKNVSGYFELEAEDEDTNARGFEVGVSDAWLTYTHSDAVKLQATWGSLLATDPYDTYSGARRLTRGTQSVIARSFGGADAGGSLDTSRQSLSVFGRPMENVYYSVGVAGVADDAEGVNPGTIYGRVAVDVMPDVMVGLLYLDGKCETGATNCAVDRDYTRFGIDAQADIGNARVMAAWLSADDDNAAATSEVENDAWYLQGEYVIKKDGRPQIVPLLRIDSYETNNGADDYMSATLNVGYYFTQNIRGFAEYFREFDVPSTDSEDKRFTLQLEAGF